jgi:hypothetical protein
MSQAKTHNTAREALLSRIKIHPRYQDERTQTFIKLTILVVILAGLYEWSRTFNGTPLIWAAFFEVACTIVDEDEGSRGWWLEA